MENSTARKTLVNNYSKIIEHLTVFAPQARNVLLASAEPEEGRTTTAIGLGLTAALLKPRKRIVIVDLDLRNPMLHRTFGAENNVGITGVIAGKSKMEEVVVSTNLKNIELITSGQEAVDFPEVFQSTKLMDFLKDLKSKYDLAFFDSPPIKKYMDGSLLSSIMDRVVMVIRSEVSKADAVISAKDDICREDNKMLGAILNDFHNPVPSFLARHL